MGIHLRPDVATTSPTRLLLACHAQNVQSRASHLSPDEIGLSARGWEETITLAQWLYDHAEINFLVTDTPLRARLTAQRIGQRLGLPSQVLPFLPRGGVAAWAMQPPRAASPDTPSLEDLSLYTAYVEKMMAACEQILAERWGKTTLLVADGVAIATLVRCFVGSPHAGIQIGLTSLTELQYQEGCWSLAYSNRAEHQPQRIRPPRILPTETADPDQWPETEMAAESEKAARFYNELALRLGQEPRQAEDHNRPGHSEVSGEMLYRFGDLEGCRLLLAGAGSGRLALDLALAGVAEVVGVDVSPGMLEQAEFLRLATQDSRLQGVNFRLAPVHALPFANGRFDAALCVHLLHHLAKPLPALRELHRVLPAHGKLILVDVNGSTDTVKRATQNAIESKRNPTHATIRTQPQWTALLEQSGFQVEKEQSWVVERSATAWLDSIAVDDITHLAVIEMLEASIETDAAGLHVRRQNGELRFDVPVIALLARKAAE